MSIETMELGQHLETISLGNSVVGDAIAGLDGAPIGSVADGFDPDLDAEDDLADAPSLGPAWFLASELLRRHLAKAPASQHDLAKRFPMLGIDVRRLLRTLEAAGLAQQRKYTSPSGRVSAGKWTLTERGRHAGSWAGPELGSLDRFAYAREMANALGLTLGINVHDIYRGPTHGIAVFARARFCAALDSIGWPTDAIARHFGMNPAWVEQGIERWKRVHMGLEVGANPDRTPGPVAVVAPRTEPASTRAVTHA